MLPLPVPASVYGLVLLLAALNFGFVKLAMTGRKKKEADHAE